MSKKALAEVVGNLVVDPDFRKQFDANPDSVLKDFDLTAAEKEELKKRVGKGLGGMSVQEVAGALGGTGTGNILDR